MVSEERLRAKLWTLTLEINGVPHWWNGCAWTTDESDQGLWSYDAARKERMRIRSYYHPVDGEERPDPEVKESTYRGRI